MSPGARASREHGFAAIVAKLPVAERAAAVAEAIGTAPAA
jgi:hypothetical protein